MSTPLCIIENVQIDNRITTGELTTIFILFATMVVAIIYAYLTYKLWREANFQSSLSISPYVVFQIDDDDALYVKNIGNSVAFNVTIDPFIFIVKNTTLKGRRIRTLKFDIINFLEAKESKEVKHDTIFSEGTPSPDFSLVYHLNPKYQHTENYLFTINYTNIIGNRYATKFYVGKDGVQIKKIYRVGALMKINRLISVIFNKIRVLIKC